MASPATLKDLATPEGAAALARRVGGVESFYQEGPEAAQAVVDLVKKQITESPELADIKARIQPGILGGYYPSADTVTLGVSNPAVAAHELGHAKNIRNTKLYGKLLQAANSLARTNNMVALPAMLALRAFVGDESTRNEILSILSGASAAVAAPGLIEEVSASIDAVKQSPDKLKALKSLVPAFLHHAVTASIPIGIYQLGRHM